MEEKPIDKLKKTLSKEELLLLEQAIIKEREIITSRFPLVVTVIGVFGVVATLFGIEKLIDQTFLANEPWLLLIIGIGTLLITGLLYKKL